MVEKDHQRQIVLTGDRPTGPLHLGHYVGSLASRLELQGRCDQYVMIADGQALTDHAKEPEKVHASVREVLLDYLSVGMDPQKSVIFIQSMVPALCELTFYYLNLVTWNRLKHNPTVKQEIRQKKFKDSVPAGFMTYPVSQAADITAFLANLVPVGEDQLPMIEQTNEIVRAFNKTYQTNVLVEVEARIPKISRLCGIDGREKMGKSLGNAIYLKDPVADVEKKVKKMYTDPNHLRIEDPGTVEGNPVFIYLDAFGTDVDKIADLKSHYQRGGLGDSVVKKYLLEVLLSFLEPIQKRRKMFSQNLDGVWKVAREGTSKAQEVAQMTLYRVKEAMQLHYF